MPRKVNYLIDYDEDYDVYDDYDEYDDQDWDHGVEGNDYHDVNGNHCNNDREGNVSSSQQDNTGSKSGLWRCSICTYDNDGSSLSCDMCGAIPSSSVNLEKDASAGPSARLPRYNETRSLSNLSQDKEKGITKFLATDEIISKLSASAGPSARLPRYNETRSLSNPSQDKEKGRTKFLATDEIISGSSHSKGFSESSGTSASIEEKGTVKLPPNNKITNNSSLSPSKHSHLKGFESYSKRESADTPQILATKVENVKLDNKLASMRNDNSSALYKPEKWMLSDQEQGTTNQLNLAIVGHVDSGKSTLSGRLLHLLGRISKKEMHKYEAAAKQMGKGSFAYAWAMDESVEERERGITMTVAVAYFDSKNYRVVLLDSPGHKDFVSNMILGATQADAAVLVVDASKGSFEAGMDGNGIGQTKEHAQLIRSFGVEQIIVAVNKMDAVDFSKERFDFIKLQLGTFLRSCGFKESSVTWIPLSAMENQNLVTRSSDNRLLSWHQGECLLEAIDSLQPPLRDISKPLRLPICDVTKFHSLGQIAASGKLESGAIRTGSKVLVMPSGVIATVRSIERDSSTCSVARAGDNVAISLQGIEWGHVMPGGVLCHPDFPVALATSLELKILVLDVPTPIFAGCQVEFHIHHAKMAAKIVKIVSLLDPKTGKVSRSSPRVLRAKQSAIIEVAFEDAVCVEEFSKCKALGRAFLRSAGNTIAVGVVNRVLERSLLAQ